MTNKFKYGKSSRENLYGSDDRPGVHPDLAKVCERALDYSAYDLSITSGVRLTAEQAEYFRKGYSQLDGVTKLSDHQIALAIDFLPVPIYIDGVRQNMYHIHIPEIRAVWYECHRAFMRAGMKEGLILEFGLGYNMGNPKSHDYPHISCKGRVPKDYSGMGIDTSMLLRYTPPINT